MDTKHSPIHCPNTFSLHADRIAHQRTHISTRTRTHALSHAHQDATCLNSMLLNSPLLPTPLKNTRPTAHAM